MKACRNYCSIVIALYFKRTPQTVPNSFRNAMPLMYNVNYDTAKALLQHDAYNTHIASPGKLQNNMTFLSADNSPPPLDNETNRMCNIHA